MTEVQRARFERLFYGYSDETPAYRALLASLEDRWRQLAAAADADGRITLDEYEQWCAALGIAGEMDAEGAFLGFDKNLDGHLSREKLANVSRQFWLSLNPNVPGHRWVGP